MCKSIGTSIAAFFTTLVSMSIVVSISRKPEHLFVAVFLFTISLMQLADALLWKSIKDGSIKSNLFVSKYILILILVSEFLVSYYGIRYFFGWSNKLYEIILWVVVIRGLYIWSAKCKATDVYTDGYLRWCNKNIKLRDKIGCLFMLVFPIIMGYPNILLKWILLGFIFITFIIQVWYVTFGSRWCWIANPASVLVMLTVVYQKFIQ